MATKKNAEKKSAKAKVSESKAKKAESQEKPKLTNIQGGKIVFRDGTSAHYVLELYRKYGNNTKKITDGLQKAVDNGDIKSNNVPARVARTLFEIHKREKAGYSI